METCINVFELFKGTISVRSYYNILQYNQNVLNIQTAQIGSSLTEQIQQYFLIKLLNVYKSILCCHDFSSKVRGRLAGDYSVIFIIENR